MRRSTKQATHMGVNRQMVENPDTGKMELESTDSYIDRVREEAKARELVEPGYVASEMRARLSDYAMGGARGATAIPKRYRGRLFEAGIESADPEVIVRGIARNIKRRHQWNMVGDTVETHSFGWSRGEQGRGNSINQIMLEAERQGIDPDDLGYFNPKVWRESRESATEGDTGDITGAPEEAVADATMEQAVQRATATADDLGGLSPAFKTESGWVALPKEAIDELQARVRANNLLGRLAEIGTQKASRIILGANPPWLAFQVASNAALTILGGAGPGSIVRAQAWWARLSPEERRHIEPYIGAGHFASDVKQTRLGASANQMRFGLDNIVHSWGAIKRSNFGAAAGRHNPLDALFKLDNAQNNFFRRAILYNRLRREAYDRMGANANAMMKVQDRVVNVMRLDPDDQIRWMVRNTDALDRHAKAVSDFLGDYTSFTARERAIFKRHVMFYGYLRFSLRFAFATLPMKRPVMTGLMGNLARLSADNIRELLGGDVLPFALGNIYTNEGKRVIELRRMNPLMNALVEATNPRQAAGIFSPWYGMIGSQIFQRDLFTGRDWLVEGESTARRYTSIDPEERLRIFANAGFKMFYPTRVLSELAEQGQPQGADTLFFDTRPTQYAPGGEADKRAKKRARMWQEVGLRGMLLNELLPFRPRSSEEMMAVVKGLQEAREEEIDRLDPDKPDQSSDDGRAPWRPSSSSSSSSGKAPWRD